MNLEFGNRQIPKAIFGLSLFTLKERSDGKLPSLALLVFFGT